MRNLLDKDFLLPNCFFSSAFISILTVMVLFPIVKDHESIRIAISGIVNAIIVLIFFLEYIKILKANRYKQTFVLSIEAICATALMHIIATVQYGFSLARLESFLIAMLFSLQYFFVAIYIVEYNKTKTLLKNFDIYVFVLLIFSIIYIARFFICQGDDLISFAGMAYMLIAYTYMTSLIAIIWKVLYCQENYQKLKWVALFAFWVVIVYSGTRGPLACMIGFVTLIVIYDIICQRAKQLKKILLIGISFLSIFLFSVYIWSPVTTGSAGRLQNFDYDADIYNEQKTNTLSEKDINGINFGKSQRLNSTALSIQEIYVQYIIESDNNIQVSLRELNHNRCSNGKKVLDTNNETLESDFKEYMLYQGRDVLREFAIGEFRKSPIWGNGIMYYANKYDNYPHNIILEILCDFGIIGAIVFIILMMTLLILNLKHIKNDNSVAFLIILSITWAASFLLSDTMYNGGIWVFIYTFGTYNYLKNRRSRQCG